MGNKLVKSFNGQNSPDSYRGQGNALSLNGSVILLTPEGRTVKDNSGAFTYEYDLKDHLGNTRGFLCSNTYKWLSYTVQANSKTIQGLLSFWVRNGS